MKQDIGLKVKYAIVGLVLGVILTSVYGFSMAGWVTEGTASDMSDTAVLAQQASICVAQFMMDPNREERMATFKELPSWNRREFITEGGWDKMPGQDVASSTVASACRDSLEDSVAMN